MRFVSRLHVCAAASTLMILYFTWVHHSPSLEDTVQTAWRGKAHRIVVFGNDWSDTGNYRIAPPALTSMAPRDMDRGELWVETLCNELACDTIDNFAHSVPSAAGAAHIGSLVDSDVHALAKPGKSNDSSLTSFDFKTQVEQFLTFDRGKRRIPQRLRKVDEWTFFTVYFGLWDLLEYSTIEKQAAMQAIDRSIEELFRNLEALVEHTGSPLQVVMPMMIDVTFLPWFQSKRNATQEQYAAIQHHLVFLWTYWNTVLLRSASQWENGTVFLPDPNDLIMEQVRAKQLHSRHISDASGIGKQAPLFEYIEEPCLSRKVEGGTSNLQAAAVEKCSAPAQHLFWDDVQLSGPAHELIGRQAVSLVRRNQTLEMERATQGSDGNGKPKGKQGDGFNLKFPPGY